MSDTDERNLAGDSTNESQDFIDGINADDEDDFEDCEENESKTFHINNGRDDDDGDNDRDRNCTPQQLHQDSKFVVPVKRWKDYLAIKDDKKICLKEFFDRDEQSAIRDDCRKLVEKLGNSESDQVAILSDLESIITTCAEESNCKYFSDNGWLEIIKPLLALKVPRDDAYLMFNAIQQRYIPKCFSYTNQGDENDQSSHKINDQPFHLLRLLLFYHDPELGSFLDTKKINPDSYALSWVSFY